MFVFSFFCHNTVRNHLRMRASADQRPAFQTRQTDSKKQKQKNQPPQLVSGFVNTQRARSIPTFSIHPSGRFCEIPLNIHGGERAKQAPRAVDG